MICGDGGNDTLNGTTAVGGPIAVHLGDGTVSGAEDERLNGIEDALGGSDADTLLGSGASPNRLDGGPGDDRLVAAGGADSVTVSGSDDGYMAAMMSGGPGYVGGQPCDGDLFDGGPGENDSASFARVRNDGTFVTATIGGAVLDPDILTGDSGPNNLLGRGGMTSSTGVAASMTAPVAREQTARRAASSPPRPDRAT